MGMLVMSPGQFIQTCVPPFPRRLHIKVGFDWLRGSEKMFENHVYIHVHGPDAGADNPHGSKFLYKHKPSVTLIVFCKFFPFNDLRTNIPM